MDKIVALNSGGFDSICLMYYLKEEYPESEIKTIFFNYGQKSYVDEKRCAENICKKLGYEFNEIELPKFEWSKSGLVSNGETPYLEMRNLIFLSYAISMSQSIGCENIFIAFIKPQSYPDTSFEFLARMNTLISDLGIHIYAPFHTLDKEELTHYIRRYNITREDFCSCLGTEKNTGVMCPNCEYFDYLYNTELKPFLLDDLYVQKDFKSIYGIGRETPITKAKLFINDICNMNCSYCLTQGVSPKTQYSPEIWSKIIRHLYDLGIKYIDFTGKEPFVNDDIFCILDSLDSTVKDSVCFSAITNGKNLNKYSNKIIGSCLSQITLSDDGGVVRDVNIISLIKKFKPSIPKLSVSFDLHNLNKDICVDYLSSLLNLGVSVYVKPILSYRGMFKEYQLTQPDFYWVIESLCDTLSLEQKSLLTISVPFQYKGISDKTFMHTDLYTNTYKGIHLSHDLYCVSGFDTVFVYSDGSFSGCGNSVFNECHKRDANILEIVDSKSLKSLIVSKGERMCCKK